MKSFGTWILIIAIGATAYVLGAKAGRSRYREVVHAAKTFWNDPTVAKARTRAVKSAKKATATASKNAEKARKRAVKKIQKAL
ncbi:hypothetical protein [Microbacterium rhizomatis]|uniref:YtxH domain-containing protein n=1 Tax=Microbacterium rhizomatis TaxID=1631477 RepID=A0A5J5IZ84_9MICO|nr:hypothetical protein [Microbacterium rhizomatis]KAA9107702.1 hypothetical protein F6B43_09640 [Microbacterium rhizomatis]